MKRACRKFITHLHEKNAFAGANIPSVKINCVRTKKRSLSIIVMLLIINVVFSQSNPGLGDVSNSFYDTFDDATVDQSKWTIMNQVWSTNNGGVVPANVAELNGSLRIEAHGDYYTGSVAGHGRNTRVGGAIKTNAKMGPGTYEVRAKICPQLGALTAFWTYEYGTNGQTGYSEIDFETPGDISLNKIICTNYSTETVYSSSVIPVAQNDGNFHTYKFEWYPASVTSSPYVKYYFDGSLILTSTTNVPNYNAQFNLGVWFPNGWAGTPNFNIDYMYIDWVKITPAGSASPTVSCSITSPANGASFTTGSNVTVNATASTSSGTITAVEFYQNGTYLGVDNSSPFSYTISAITTGSHALEAVAYNSSGAYAASGVVNITVSTASSITCNITSPSNGATYTAGSNVIINASASTSSGSISAVEFYRNGTYLGVDNSSPFSYTISGITAGSHSLEAVAYSTSGSYATSSAVSITVNTGSSNIAINKTATASSVEAGGLEAAKAFDGNSATRWSSLYTNTQWIYVDLGDTYNISRVKINWEAAYGKNFRIQVSSNASSWTTIKTVTNNTSLTNDFTGLSGSGRYVRMYATARGTSYGYSIYEMEVYGTASSLKTVTDMESQDNNISVFPNPVINVLNIKNTSDMPANIEIYSINGKLLYKANTNGSLTQISTAEIKLKGLVLVKVITAEKTSVFKAVIK